MPNSKSAVPRSTKPLQKESKKHRAVRDVWTQYKAHANTGVKISNEFRRSILNLVDSFFPEGI